MSSLSVEQKTSIRKFILSLTDDQSRLLNDSDSLVRSGLIDSIKIAQIVIFLEGDHSISLKDEHLVPETFETVSALFSVLENQKG